MRFADELRNAVTPRAAALVIGVLALQLLFIASYIGALHHPDPKDVKVAVVAPPQAAEQAIERLRALPGDPLDPRALTDEQDARGQMLQRDIDAALLIDPRSTEDTLLTASGQGAAETRALIRIFEQVERAQQRTLAVEDVAPASAGDAGGLSSFYLVVGWCVGGYLCAAVLAISAGARPANSSRALLRLAVMALYSVVSGLLGAVIAGPVLGALPGSVAALWGLGALVVFAVGAATLALQSLFGIVGIGLAILLVVIAGNPSAGGAVPGPLLPDFWRSIGPALPPGAGTWTARSIAYFLGNAVMGPLLVLSAWAAVGTSITLIMASLRRNGEEDGGPVGAGTSPRAPA
ncbi:ABC transporter permease [Streptomyces sp. HNM0663]|uniref:ABC transporter permease n=1 Tax=Streptomyces chengmaiensis TaxID=3040919 RepID=A0ABT6HRZ3_9ACTN|nr:ABC transporter permease [Streptomyces chengmaiensis]MDH2391485.1 ABC transporter permease [Streptomyces chengmaiensis]